jgi:hypothetical protein
MDKDDLLQPVLQGREPTPYLPWRLTSQVYVGFFGGALALGGIAFLNAAMLGMSYLARVAIVAVVLAAEAAFATFVALTGIDEIRIASTAAGLVAYGGVYLIQRSADRVYHFHADDPDEYQSLVGPGLVAVIFARVLETLLAEGLQGG